MAELIAAVESELDTDYALLYAVQGLDGHRDLVESMGLAVSGTGGIALTCGTKYARLHVRLERWDGPPDPPPPHWEDRDEVPWEPVPEGGPVQVHGFDPADDDTPGLPVDGLGRARVEVLAAGRYRYSSSDAGDPEEEEDLPPERWLLRFHPDPEHRDAMTAPPRRMAGPHPFAVRLEGWGAAMQSWRYGGWDDLFFPLPAFRLIRQSLTTIGRACRPDELIRHWGPWGAELERHGPHGWDSPVLGHPTQPDALRQELLDEVELLAAAAGMPAIETFADALTCLERLGLVGRCDAPEPGMLIPNPGPRTAVEVLRLAPERQRLLQERMLSARFAPFAGDLQHLVRWAPDQVLAATPQAVAVRLAVPVADVLGTIRLLTLTGRYTVSPDAARLTPATPFRLTRAPSPDGGAGPT